MSRRWAFDGPDQYHATLWEEVIMTAKVVATTATPDTTPADAPTVTLKVSGSMGELRIEE